MPRLTRKDFLGLSAATAAAALVGRPAAAQVRATPTVGPARRTLVRGADLLTMDPQLGEMTGADVLLDGGKIAAIGKGLTAADAEMIDARGMILMPGMIDGHRHVWSGIEAGRLVKTSKGYNLDAYQSWKMKLMVCFTPEDAYLCEYVGGLQAIDSGVTSLVDYAHIFHTPELAEQAARGMKDAGAAGFYCYQVAHTPSYKPGDRVPFARANAERRAPPDELHWKNAALIRDRVFNDSSAPMQFGIATSNAMPVRPMTEVRDEFIRIRTMEPGLIVQHVHKPRTTPPEHIFREIGQLHSAGLLGPDYHISHANDLTATELAMLRDTGSMICATVMGEFPYPSPAVHGRARQAGVAVGIGIDIGLALTQDYFEHVRVSFWNLFRSAEGAAIAKSYESEDVLDFATRLGAKAMRLGDVAGTVTVGKRADLVLLRTDRFGFPTAGSLADRVVNFASLPDIDSVWIAGVLRKRGGQMIGADWPKLKERVTEMQSRMHRQAETITFTT